MGDTVVSIHTRNNILRGTWNRYPEVLLYPGSMLDPVWLRKLSGNIPEKSGKYPVNPDTTNGKTGSATGAHLVPAGQMLGKRKIARPSISLPPHYRKNDL